MFIAELRTATMSAHQSLDKMLIPHIKGMQTPQQYADLLRCFYGYFTPVEEKLAAYLSDERVPAFTERRKANVISNELHEMGEAPAEEKATETPNIDSISKAFGAMYVLEGSTLGGKIIAKIIGSNLDKDPSTLRFFNYYGDNTDAMWQSFSDALNGYAETLDEAGKQEMVQAAIDTFHQFRSWIEYSYVPQQQ